MGALEKVLGSVSLVGGLVGAAVLGGATAHRLAMLHYRELGQIPDGYPAGPFDGLRSDRDYSVAAPDGVALHVEEVGPVDAPLTVVFSHGWTLRSGAWHFQRDALQGPGFGEGTDPAAPSPVPDLPQAAPGRRGRQAAPRASDLEAAPSARPSARLVFYDQRSHGRSSRAPAGRSTIADLAADLATVIATAAPDGPLVLAGHSMGGMAVIALAGREPELFAGRVRGVALISTSADETSGGSPRFTQVNGANPLLPALAAAAARYPRAFERGRGLSRDIRWLLTRSLGFADPNVPAPLVDYLDQMIMSTPIDVIAEFAPALFSFDESAAVPALSGIPALIAVGEQDRMTPPARAGAIGEVLPGAELLVIPGAGHMVIMEAPDVVNRALRRLLWRAWDGARNGSAATAP